MEYPKWATPERRAYLVELAQTTCAKGENPCPVMVRFAQAIVDKIGPPTGNQWVWLARAAMATPKLLEAMPELDRYHIPPWVRSELVALWKAQDRERRSQLQKLEGRHAHAAPQIWKRGPFDSIRRAQYLDDRPLFQIVAIGVNAFTQHRVAQVVIPGLRKMVWVDLPGIKLSKNKLHKLARYKRGSVPKEAVPQVESRVRTQVARFL